MSPRCDLPPPPLALPVAVLTFLIVALFAYYSLHLNAAKRRASMPVRVTIHSLLVSMP